MKAFNELYENKLERYQQGGVIVGDRVTFKKDCLSLDYIKNRAKSYQDLIISCMKSDLNLRVGAVKSIYPTTTQNYQGGSEAPDGVFLDIYVEYNPGFFANPMTVPIEAVVVMDDGNNRGPIPDSLKRKSKIHGPEKIKAEQPKDNGPKVELNLQNKNQVIPNSNKWDDTKPGAGNF